MRWKSGVMSKVLRRAVPRCGFLRRWRRAWIDSGREPAKPWFDEFSASAGPYLWGGGGGVARLRLRLGEGLGVRGLRRRRAPARRRRAPGRRRPRCCSASRCCRRSAAIEVVRGLSRSAAAGLAVLPVRAHVLGDRRDAARRSDRPRRAARSWPPRPPPASADRPWRRRRDCRRRRPAARRRRPPASSRAADRARRTFTKRLDRTVHFPVRSYAMIETGERARALSPPEERPMSEQTSPTKAAQGRQGRRRPAKARRRPRPKAAKANGKGKPSQGEAAEAAADPRSASCPGLTAERGQSRPIRRPRAPPRLDLGAMTAEQRAASRSSP